jgi:protein BCP1
MPKRRDDAEDDEGLIHVDFEFFDPRASDFLALKRLLSQLFQDDGQNFRLDELAELIISQPLLGTTVKVDGIESDPYAFLTVLNINTHQKHPAIQAIVKFFQTTVVANTASQSRLRTMLSPQGLGSSQHLGLIVSERLVNMPVEIVPPMYKMLVDEMKWANDEEEPYLFDSFLFISRGYRISAEEATDLTPRVAKRAKFSAERDTSLNAQVHPFHPEDSIIAKFASFSVEFEFPRNEERRPDDFGLDVVGQIMLVPATRFQDLVSAISAAFPPPS